jgi:putative acetyltransferase
MRSAGDRAMTAPTHPPLLIRVDDLRGPEIAALLEEHLEDMRASSPADSCHALDIDGLRRPEVTFWTAWEGPALAGCGALKRLDATHAEIKSMRTSPAFRGRGIASQMLGHILNEASGRGYLRVSLETGAAEFFAPARALYEKFGFISCPPFEGYREDPHSCFYTRELVSGRG